MTAQGRFQHSRESGLLHERKGEAAAGRASNQQLSRAESCVARFHFYCAHAFWIGGNQIGCSASGRAVRASCARPATAVQRRATLQAICYSGQVRPHSLVRSCQRGHYYSLVSLAINAGDQVLPPSFE